ncbi:hypothetical protein K435DRAFT_960255, partial [Dendrothele bispora CBS 962.96]
MFHGSSNSEFNNGRFNNVGRDNIVYYIHGNTTIYCSSTDLAALPINSAKSSVILQDATPSQREHVNFDGEMRAGSTLTEDNGSATGKIGVAAPRRVKRDSSACKNQPGYSSPRTSTQGKEDQQATPAANGDQTSKIFQVDIDRIT